MGIFIANAVNILYGSYDLTCDSNKVDLSGAADAKDRTTFCSLGWIERAGGLKSLSFDASGFWQADGTTTQAVHDQAFANLGGAAFPVTVIPEGSVGGVAAFFQASEAEYQPTFQVGELAQFDVKAQGSSGAGIVGGYLFLDKQARTSSGTSAIINIPGGIPAGQSLYAAVHTFAKSGTTPTLDITVKSAALVGFGSPTTRLTVPTVSTVSGVWATPVSPTTTDAYYRVDYTIAGTSPSFTFAVAVGIK